jgi:hypothetical protein
VGVRDDGGVWAMDESGRGRSGVVAVLYCIPRRI